MDETKLKKACLALQWEARYRKGEHLAGKGAFLPGLETLDKDFAEASRLFGVSGGSVLDIGTDIGVQAIRYAQLGFNVTAIDVSPTAIENALKNAATAGVCSDAIRFVTDNILMCALQGTFDLITDRGCYTLLEKWMLEDYCRNVHRLLSPDGLFLLKVDAKRKDKADFLTTRFRIIQSWNTHYNGEQRQGPKANFFILKHIPA